jgi:hypothetical protein
MNCVILQPSYIPWRGYFHQIYKADLFIFYDDIQFDKHGWRNRNQIKTSQGKQWLTIPVHSQGVVDEKKTINRIRIDWSRPWNKNHWKALTFAYGKAPFFSQSLGFLEPFYNRHDEYLADFTVDLTVAIARAMGIASTRFMRSSELGVSGQKTDRLIQILKQVGATHYISGPSAKEYLQEDEFRAAEISLEYMAYDYPEYPQLYPPFDSYISILDLLFMVGDQALSFIVPERKS